MTNKPASEVKIGDKVCEADGFQWEVKAIESTKCFVVLTLAPVFQTMLREQEHKLRVKMTSLMRVA